MRHQSRSGRFKRKKMIMKIWNTFVAVALLSVGCAAPSSDAGEGATADELRRGEVLGFTGAVTREEISVAADGRRTFSPRVEVGKGVVSIRLRQTETSCSEGTVAATVRAEVPSIDAPEKSVQLILPMSLRNEDVTYNTSEWVGRAVDGETTYELRFRNTLSEICQSHAGKTDALTHASFGMWNDRATQNVSME